MQSDNTNRNSDYLLSGVSQSNSNTSGLDPDRVEVENPLIKQASPQPQEQEQQQQQQINNNREPLLPEKHRSNTFPHNPATTPPDKQDLLNSYKKIHSIFTIQRRAIQTAYNKFSDFDNAGYKRKLLNSYNTIHSIHENQQKALKTAYGQFSDFDNAGYKKKLLNSYNTMHSIHENQQKALKTAYGQFSDFDSAGYKKKLLNSYNTIHSIHENQQKALNTAYSKFSDFDNAGYKNELMGYYNVIHSIFVNQQKQIQSALKSFKEKPPVVPGNTLQPLPPNILPPSLPQENDLDKLIKTIIETPTQNNKENVVKLLELLKDYPKSKALSLIIVSSLLFIDSEKTHPNLGELIEKMNERLGTSINIPPSIIENDEQKEALLNMVQHENIKQLYSPRE